VIIFEIVAETEGEMAVQGGLQTEVAVDPEIARVDEIGIGGDSTGLL
jgi:hypothetical protein